MSIEDQLPVLLTPELRLTNQTGTPGILETQKDERTVLGLTPKVKCCSLEKTNTTPAHM